MSPAHGIWWETVSLLDVMWPWSSMSWSGALIMHLSLLYSWRFSRYSTPIHWLDHSHMTSNKETVSRQMPWAGNIAKTMMSNGKQFTVTRPMLTAVARDHWSLLGERWILFPSNLNVSLDFISGNIEIRGKQNSLFSKEIPAITCNSGQHLAGNSELFPVWRHSFCNAARSWHLAGNSFFVRCHVTMI